jgi:hypothetical protein
MAPSPFFPISHLEAAAQLLVLSAPALSPPGSLAPGVCVGEVQKGGCSLTFLQAQLCIKIMFYKLQPTFSKFFYKKKISSILSALGQAWHE